MSSELCDGVGGSQQQPDHTSRDGTDLKRTNTTDGECPSDEDEDFVRLDSNNSRTRSGSYAMSLLACPYRQHDPLKYALGTHAVCLRPWPTISRLKYETQEFQVSNNSLLNRRGREHLYRGHKMPIHCKRCKAVFDDQEKLKAHELLDPTQICKVQLDVQLNGITPEQMSQLKSRKKIFRAQSDADRWRVIYQVLFPNEDVPSPCKPLLFTRNGYFNLHSR